MAKAKKKGTTKKFAAVKRMINPNDGRIKKNQAKTSTQQPRVACFAFGPFKRRSIMPYALFFRMILTNIH